MGKFFGTDTWRAPLLLIDSWSFVRPSRLAAAPPLRQPALLQKFARAGWMRHSQAKAPCLPGPRSTEPQTLLARPDTTPPRMRQAPSFFSPRVCQVRLLKAETLASGGKQTRMVISGRIGDVCAELERLEAIETRPVRRHRDFET